MMRQCDVTALDGLDDDVARAVAALRAGDLVAFPTETVYGLGADAANPDAVRRLYAVKGRPADHPVIVHLGHAAQLDELAAEVPDTARRLATACWPGPLTIVVRRDPERVAAALTGGRDTVGLRVPDHPVALRLLESFGGGLAAPSANRFGRVSPTTAAHVLADLGADVEVVLDGGTCRVGVESTIVDVTGREPAILASAARAAPTSNWPSAAHACCARPASSRLRARSRRITHHEPRSKSSTPKPSLNERMSSSPASDGPACSRSGRWHRTSPSSWLCSTRRVTPTNTRAALRTAPRGRRAGARRAAGRESGVVRRARRGRRGPGAARRTLSHKTSRRDGGG